MGKAAGTMAWNPSQGKGKPGDKGGGKGDGESTAAAPKHLRDRLRRSWGRAIAFYAPIIVCEWSAALRK